MRRKCSQSAWHRNHGSPLPFITPVCLWWLVRQQQFALPQPSSSFRNTPATTLFYFWPSHADRGEAEQHPTGLLTHTGCSHGCRRSVLHLRHGASPPLHHPRSCAIDQDRRPNTVSWRWLLSSCAYAQVQLQGCQTCTQGSRREVLVQDPCQSPFVVKTKLFPESSTLQKTMLYSASHDQQ